MATPPTSTPGRGRPRPLAPNSPTSLSMRNPDQAALDMSEIFGSVAPVRGVKFSESYRDPIVSNNSRGKKASIPAVLYPDMRKRNKLLKDSGAQTEKKLDEDVKGRAEIEAARGTPLTPRSPSSRRETTIEGPRPAVWKQLTTLPIIGFLLFIIGGRIWNAFPYNPDAPSPNIPGPPIPTQPMYSPVNISAIPFSPNDTLPWAHAVLSNLPLAVPSHLASGASSLQKSRADLILLSSWLSPDQTEQSIQFPNLNPTASSITAKIADLRAAIGLLLVSRNDLFAMRKIEDLANIIERQRQRHGPGWARISDMTKTYVDALTAFDTWHVAGLGKPGVQAEIETLLAVDLATGTERTGMEGDETLLAVDLATVTQRTGMEGDEKQKERVQSGRVYGVPRGDNSTDEEVAARHEWRAAQAQWQKSVVACRKEFVNKLFAEIAEQARILETNRQVLVKVQHLFLTRGSKADKRDVKGAAVTISMVQNWAQIMSSEGRVFVERREKEAREEREGKGPVEMCGDKWVKQSLPKPEGLQRLLEAGRWGVGMVKVAYRTFVAVVARRD